MEDAPVGLSVFQCYTHNRVGPPTSKMNVVDAEMLFFLLQRSCLSIRDHPAIEEGAADVVEPALVTPLTEVLRAAPMRVDEVSFLVTRPWIRTFAMRRISFATAATARATPRARCLFLRPPMQAPEQRPAMFAGMRVSDD